MVVGAALVVEVLLEVGVALEVGGSGTVGMVEGGDEGFVVSVSAVQPTASTAAKAVAARRAGRCVRVMVDGPFQVRVGRWLRSDGRRLGRCVGSCHVLAGDEVSAGGGCGRAVAGENEGSGPERE